MYESYCSAPCTYSILRSLTSCDDLVRPSSQSFKSDGCVHGIGWLRVKSWVHLLTFSREKIWNEITFARPCAMTQPVAILPSSSYPCVWDRLL